jgi:hypothetical protein
VLAKDDGKTVVWLQSPWELIKSGTPSASAMCEPQKAGGLQMTASVRKSEPRTAKAKAKAKAKPGP